MKKLLYSGLTALMMLFAIGSANAQSSKVSLDTVKVALNPTDFTLNAETQPQFTITIGEGNDFFTVSPASGSTVNEGTLLTITPKGYVESAFGCVYIPFATLAEAVEDNSSMTTADYTYSETYKPRITSESAVFKIGALTSDGWKVVLVRYNINKGEIANPSFLVNGMSYTGKMITATDVITIMPEDDDEHTEIWYTTDGTEPAKDQGTKYTGTFTLSEDKVVKAIAVNSEGKTSAIVEAHFTVGEAVKPQIALYGQTQNEITSEYGKYVGFYAMVMVDEQPSDKAMVYYTTDGTTVPDMEAYYEQTGEDGPIYYVASDEETGEYPKIMLTGNTTTLKVIGYAMINDEPVASDVETYTLTATSVTNPTLNQTAGEVASGTVVKVQDANDYEMILYTLNGSVPSYDRMAAYEDDVYIYDDEDGIEITENVTVSVIAYTATGTGGSRIYAGSDLVTAAYTVSASGSEETLSNAPQRKVTAPKTVKPVAAWNRFAQKKAAMATAARTNSNAYVTLGTGEEDLAILVTFTKATATQTEEGEEAGEAITQLLTAATTPLSSAVMEKLSEGAWNITYKMVKGNDATADFTGAVLKVDAAAGAITVQPSEGPEPAGDLFVLSPATGSTVNVGDEITITSATVDDDEISYKWFATRTEAEAAEFSYATWSNYDDAGKPVVAAGLPVLAVTKGFMTETAGSRMYAEYTINAAAPGVEITFMPADGAEVEVGDTIKLAANDDVTIVYMMFPSKDIAQVSDWKWNEEGVEGEQVGFVYGSDYPVITETMKALKVGYITAENLDSEEPENVWFYAEYTIKGGETPGKLDVDIEFMTDAYGQARFAKKSDKIRLVLEDYEGIELYYAIVTDEEEQPSYVQYGEGLIGLSELEGNFTVKAYAVKGIQRSDVFSAEYVLLDIIEPTLEFDATAAKNYPMEFNVKSVSYPDIMDKDMMVYYTLDGETEPSDTAFLNQEGDVIKYLQKQEGIWQNYLEPTENITVWAKAYVLLDEGANLVMETPAVKKAVEMSELSNPVITPAVAATEYNAGDTVKVAIEVPEDADVLYYTLDGSEPLFSRTIGNEDLIDSVIFAYYPSWGEPFDTIVVTKSTTVKAIAYKEPAFRMGYVPGAGSDVVSATFGFKVELTFNPESGSEVYEGTRVAITSEDETIDIFYMMFESEEAAKAAEWNQEEAELYGEMQPVVTKSSNTVKVAYARRGATEVTENFFYATYTVKELPAVTLTLNPATGSEVEENTKVTVTPSRELVEGEAIVFRMFANKTAADTCADDVMINEGMIYGEPDEDDDQIGYPVITQEAPVLKIGVLGAMDEEGNWIYNWIVAEYKIKGQVSANEAGELAGVSIYPNPTEGEFNVVAPVNAEVEIFNATGVVVKRVNVSAGANAMRLENSGIYFVRVRANGQMAVKKVVIR